MKPALLAAAGGLAIVAMVTKVNAGPVSSNPVYEPGLGITPAATYDFQYRYYSVPPVEDLEAMLVVDSRFWPGYSYIRRSLSAVSLESGSPSSGTFAVRGYYTYYSEHTERQWREWVIFRYTNGNFNCVLYQSRSNCRRIVGY